MADRGRLEAELSEDLKRIELSYDYDYGLTKEIRALPHVKESRKTGGFYFTTDYRSAQILSSHFGARLRIGPRLRQWGRDQATRRRSLRVAAGATTATLTTLPDRLPALYRAVHLGPKGLRMTERERIAGMKKPASFQAADVAFGARAHNYLNANHMGLGKTIETIATIFEERSDEGPQLVIAPISSLDSVWYQELRRWQDHPILVAPPDRIGREATILDAYALAEEAQPFWLVLNPAMVAYGGVYESNPEPPPKRILVDRRVDYPALFEIGWSNVVLDEAHTAGLRDEKSFTAEALRDLHSRYRKALSGTPFGGREANLWPLLTWLDPEHHRAKWRWYEQWLTLDEDRLGHRTVGGVRPEVEDAFWASLTPYILRRTKQECLPDLPPKQHIDVWCEMTREQTRQYREMATEAEVIIEEEHLSAWGILAEYTRLKQFANAACRVDRKEQPDGKIVVQVTPTGDSGKLPQVQRILEELGIWDGSSDEQCVIFSQFSTFADFLGAWLKDQKVPAAVFKGGVTRNRRTQLQQRFQSGKLRVLIMTTLAGGVSINLDRASTAIFLDETWVPDHQEQAEDRIHRASRIHQVTCYYIRSKSTIEEYIERMNWDKAAVNERILDLRRQGLRSDTVKT